MMALSEQTSGLLSTTESDCGKSTADSDCSNTKIMPASDHPGDNIVTNAPLAPLEGIPKKQRSRFSILSLRDKKQRTPSINSDQSISNSAPTILIHSDSSPALRAPLRSSMSSRTLHESLHRGRRCSAPNPRNQSRNRSISFADVKIREYERVMGDNPSVTSGKYVSLLFLCLLRCTRTYTHCPPSIPGPPISIGWRYVPEITSIPVDDYEEGKGSPRASSEFLVPKIVRERILKEHADVSRREMVQTVRTIQKEKSKRQQTVVNLPMQKAEEKVEGMKHKIKKILKPSKSYDALEVKLWDEAHQIAVDKAKRLEDSIRRGESVSSRDLYAVGTPCGNLMRSRRNSVMTPQQLQEQLQQEQPQMGDTSTTTTTIVAAVEDHDIITGEKVRTSYAPKSTNQQNNRSMHEVDNQELNHQMPTKEGGTPQKQNNRPSNIVATEDSDEEDGLLSQLLLDDASGNVSSNSSHQNE